MVMVRFAAWTHAGLVNFSSPKTIIMHVGVSAAMRILHFL
jgi:hypothetical protein